MFKTTLNLYRTYMYVSGGGGLNRNSNVLFELSFDTPTITTIIKAMQLSKFPTTKATKDLNHFHDSSIKGHKKTRLGRSAF